MTTTNQDRQIYRGNTATLSFTFSEPVSSTATFKWRMARTWHSPELATLARKALGTGLTPVTKEVVTEPPSIPAVFEIVGATVDLTEVETDLVPGLYYHELKVFDGGKVSTAIVGTVVIKRAIAMATAP